MDDVSHDSGGIPRLPEWGWLLALLIGLGLSMLVGASGWGWPASPALAQARAMRVLAGFLVGAGLSVAGATLQALLRNPLADPYVLGVSSGSALGAAAAILSGLAARHAGALPVSAFLGGLLTLALVYWIAGESREPDLHSLLLGGVIVGAIASSVLLVLITRSSSDGLRAVTWWILGSLEAAPRPLLIMCGILIVGSAVGLRAMARDLNALTLGQDAAYHLGVSPRPVILGCLALATLATAGAVALAGLIGFAGLIVPHIVRRLFGSDHRILLPLSALGGGLFLTLCDALARSLAFPTEWPIGVVTALTGGPFFLYLLRGRKRSGWGLAP